MARLVLLIIHIVLVFLVPSFISDVFVADIVFFGLFVACGFHALYLCLVTTSGDAVEATSGGAALALQDTVTTLRNTIASLERLVELKDSTIEYMEQTIDALSEQIDTRKELEDLRAQTRSLQVRTSHMRMVTVMLTETGYCTSDVALDGVLSYVGEVPSVQDSATDHRMYPAPLQTWQNN